MAEPHDEQGERTEAPTPHRLQKARERGQVASSREVGTLLILTCATLLLATAGGPAGRATAEILRASFSALATMHLDGETLPGGIRAPLLAGGLLILVPLAAFSVAAVLAAALQNAIVINREAFVPKLSRISPAAGLKRLFSARSLVELVKNLAKLVIAGIAASIALYPDLDRVSNAPDLEPIAFGSLLLALVLRLLVAVCVAVALVAAADYAFQRAEFLRQMRMSRQDIKEEHKETEGDPTVRQRLRSIRMERARQRMMAEVPKSTVVITNPTHYAVALRYEHGRDAAPRVVAKGTDLVALRIRDLARAHRVPVIEDPPLARILHATAELGRPIPPAHYEAVAKVIAVVLRMGSAGPTAGA